MDAIDVHVSHFEWAHEYMLQVTESVTSEQAHWTPPGTANPLGALMAHGVLTEDFVARTILSDQPPLYASEWEGRTGVSEPEPLIEADWAERVEIDLNPFRKYTQAVFNYTEDYVGSMSVADLERRVDLSEEGMGVHTVEEILIKFMESHLHNVIGEISVLKGLQGEQGYPF